MPDIDPAALSRPSISVSTPTLASKSIAGSGSATVKFPKTSQIIPARVDLEPIYTGLRDAIGGEHWAVYKESTTEFLIGRLNQAEYIDRIGPILSGHNGEREHLHNCLIAAIYGNVTREMPDQGPAPWVSANDKPVASAAAKPATGDATERRLKGDVMQLPAKDRRRIKDLTSNDYDPHESLSNMFTDSFRRSSTVQDSAPSATTGIHNLNFDLEIRKRFAQPLGIESGEFPDVSQISGRILPFCYEAGLANGHMQEAPQLISVAVETYIKEVLTQIFSRTRSNGPGDSGSAGFGIGTSWIQTHRYKKQLSKEEEAAHRGEITRDKVGMLPVESKAASERGPLGTADIRLALEMGDAGMFQFPMVSTQIVYGWRDGELENWNNYTWLNGSRPARVEEIWSKDVNGEVKELTNGYPEAMELDGDMVWDGAEDTDMDFLDGVLDSCLAVTS